MERKCKCGTVIDGTDALMNHRRFCDQRLSPPQCIHCGKFCAEGEGLVCDSCYSKYTPGMLADLDQ